MHVEPRGRFGKPFTFVERCASTQRLLDGAPEGAVVATDEQTEGRGRLGRSWHAPAGSSLLFSISLAPRVAAERLPELSVVAGEAVVPGIGVNVSQSEDELPADAATPATSLALEGSSVGRSELLAAILERLEAHYDAWISAAGAERR